MLHKWVSESFEQHSSFLPIIFVLLIEDMVHVLLKSIHASMERLVLLHVVTPSERMEKETFPRNDDEHGWRTSNRGSIRRMQFRPQASQGVHFSILSSLHG